MPSPPSYSTCLPPLPLHPFSSFPPQNPVLPPPPPPPPNRNNAPYNPSLGSAPVGDSRFRIHLPAISTVGLPPAPSSSNTPFSPTSSVAPTPISPFAPNMFSSFARNQSPMTGRTPSSGVSAYNPQDWNRSGPVVGGYVPHSTATVIQPTNRTLEASGMEESLPPPPPPYSPPANSSGNPAIPSPPYNGTAGVSSVSSSPYNTPLSQNGRPAVLPRPPTAERSLSRPVDQRAAMPARPLNQRPGPLNFAQSNTAGFGHSPQQVPVAPSASRRAVSASAAALPSGPHTYNSSQQVNGWDTGAGNGVSMPLPPPPAGPPPPGVSQPRSMSLNRITVNTTNTNTTFLVRRHHQSTLGDIPPTPIDWHDEFEISTGPQSAVTPESGNPNLGSQPGADSVISPTPSTVAATPASTTTPQATSATFIGSSPPPGPPSALGPGAGNGTTAQGPVVSGRPTVKPVLPSVSTSFVGPSRGPTPLNSSITSPYGPSSRASSVGLTRSGAARNPSIPRTLLDRRVSRGFGGTAEPTPVSATTKPFHALSPSNISSPPSRQLSVDSRPDSSSNPELTPTSIASTHISTHCATAVTVIKATAPVPIRAHSRSRILDNSNCEGYSSLNLDDAPRDTPTTTAQSSPVSVRAVTVDSETCPPSRASSDLFQRQSLTRFEEFLAKEASAQSDAESIRLFARFIVSESQVRRRRFAAGFEEVANEISQLTADLWKVPPPPPPAIPPPPPAKVHHTSNSIAKEARKPQPSLPALRTNTGTTPSLGTPLSPTLPSPASRLREAAFFYPNLSPIPSMNVSNAYDDEDSRGRSASRWWETSSSSSSRRVEIERSQKETKYMSVVPPGREALQWAARPTPQSATFSNGPGSSATARFWPQTDPTSPEAPLDVSRLVTLPPPYPRHYPAVNNKHPELASLRNIHRGLADMDEVRSALLAFNQNRGAMKEKRHAEMVERRKKMRQSIQSRIESGEISYADAAKEEAAFEQTEGAVRQNDAQRDLDRFQDEVMKPLNALISERITKATASIEHLRTTLEDSLKDPTPNRPQEEGDEQPEVLERLTLLKWFFEVREMLHKETFEIEKIHSLLYKDVVLTPLQAAKETDQIADVESFFKSDAQKELLRVEKESLARWEDLLKVFEANISRGAEDQLSAFWDIAPGLAEVIQKVPKGADDGLDRFRIAIPAQEYSENPVYRDHPMQYLYTLLRHAHMSAYQFIESQTNLFCLLHEVRTHVMRANSGVLLLQRVNGGDEDRAVVERETEMIRKEEDGRLTADLKEKVELVESQWMDGLGREVCACEKLVEEFLLSTNGWDDCLKE